MTAATGGASDLERIEADVRSRDRRDAARRRLFSVLTSVGSLAGVIVVWELGVRLLRVPEYLLPPPSEVAQVFLKRPLELAQHTYVTTTEILIGFGVAIVIGVLLALALHLWPMFARAANPLLVGSQALPKVAIAPLLVVWFGFGILPKLAIVFLMSFFPIVISTLVGFSSLQREHLFLAQSMGMGPGATFFRIRLPNALPNVFGGLKIAVTLAVVGAIVGEFVASDAGLGYLLLAANGRLDTPLLFASLLILTVEGLGLYWLIEVIERLALPWYDPESVLRGS